MRGWREPFLKSHAHCLRRSPYIREAKTIFCMWRLRRHACRPTLPLVNGKRARRDKTIDVRGTDDATSVELSLDAQSLKAPNDRGRICQQFQECGNPL